MKALFLTAAFLAAGSWPLLSAEADYSTNYVTHGPMLGQVTENSVKV